MWTELKGARETEESDKEEKLREKKGSQEERDTDKAGVNAEASGYEC